MKASDWVVKPALICDLDGTIRFNKDDPEGFINRWQDVKLYPGVERKLWEYRDNGYLVFGISNQGGVAFGYKDQPGVDAEIARTVELFGRNPFHVIKCCLHHEGGHIEPWNHRSLFRKPDVGMLAAIERECFDEGYVVDWDKSLMVGDRNEDAECARRAGVAFEWADTFFGRAS